MNTYKAIDYLKKNKDVIGFTAVNGIGDKKAVTLFDLIASKNNIDIGNVTVDDNFKFKVNKKDPYVYVYNKVFSGISKKKCIQIKSNIDLDTLKFSIENDTEISKKSLIGIHNNGFKWGLENVSMRKIIRELLKIGLSDNKDKDILMFNQLLVALTYDIIKENIDADFSLYDAAYSIYSFLKPSKIFGNNCSLAYPLFNNNKCIDIKSLDDIVEIIKYDLTHTTLIVLDPYEVKIKNENPSTAYSREAMKIMKY